MLPADVYARFQRARGATRCSSSAPPTSTARPTELAAAEARQGRGANTAPSSTRSRSDVGDALRLVLGLFRPLLERREPRADPALRAARCGERGLIEERVTKQVYSRRRQALPARPLCRGHLPALRLRARRAATSARTARACSIPPTSSSRARRSRARPTSRCATRKHLFLQAVASSSDELRALDRRQAGRLAAPRHLDRAANGWTKGLQDRGITRDLVWGVPVHATATAAAGLRGQGLLRLVRRADRIHRRHGRMGGRQRRGRGGLGALVAHDEGARDVTYVEFMGKDNVPFHTVGFPVTILGSGEPWKLVDQHQGLQLAQLLRRQVLDQPEARRLHGPGAGASARATTGAGI